MLVIMNFPVLPPNQWNASVLTAYDILSKEYTCCQGLVTTDGDLDPVQCRYHSNAIRKDMFPLLIALEKDLGTCRWISDITECFVQLLTGIEAIDTNRYVNLT
jgi:hypothetical protein